MPSTSEFLFNNLSFHFDFLFRFVAHIALDNDSRYLSAEESNRELTRSILREVSKLSEQWNNLIDRSDHWKHSLDEYMTVSCTENPKYYILH